MKIHLIYFNEKSILNNHLIRLINNILLIISVMASLTYFIDKIQSDQYSGKIVWILIAGIILQGIFAPIFGETAIHHIDFFEWDYRERRKKTSYILGYMMVYGIISSILIFGFSNLFLLYDTRNTDSSFWLNLGFEFASLIVLIINIFNITSLFYPFFRDNLIRTSDLVDKPQDWIDSK